VNFARLLWETTERTPSNEAVRDSTVRWTYSELTARASAIANALLQHGVQPSYRVAVLLPHGAEAAAAVYGVSATGAVVSVLNWLYRPRQVEHVLADSGAHLLLTTRSWVDQQARSLPSSVRVVFTEDLTEPASFDPVEVDDTAPAQITYTSGSTGRPKGVVFSHANLGAGIRTVVDYLGIRREDRIASLLPFGFVYGFNQLNCAVATGAALDIVDTVLAPETVRTLIERRCTILAAVPPLWTQLLRVQEFASPLTDLRVLTCAGGRLAPDAVRALRAAQPQAKLFLMYGLTEVFRSTYLPPDEVDDHPDSMGRAVPGSRVYVVREDGTLTADEEVGELVHAGPTVALGYWNDPDATARVFRPNPIEPAALAPLDRAVFSGDLVRRDGDGRLYYVGRRDRMIKTLGFRVSPDEITDVLHASGMVADAAVTAAPDAARGEKIVAHVVLAPAATLDALRVWCGTELPRHMQPAQWDVQPVLPRLASGKHDLIALATAAASVKRK
jgi:amino acid adenylation domain-containing protein